jgi:hypothetical protein
MRVAAWMLLAVGVFAPERADAELLRCKGPDGRTIYTDDKARCPGSKPFEPDAAVHKADPRNTPAASRAPLGDRRDRAEARRRAAEAEAGEARRWRQKKEQSEDALRALGERRVELHQFVAWCNRGGSVVTRDDAGIKQNVPCNQIRAEHAALDDEERKVRAYLDSGLAEECRRAGCLPGWLR